MQAIVMMLVLAGVIGAGVSLARLASGRRGRRALLASVIWTVSVAALWQVSKEGWAQHHGFSTYSDYWKASQAGYASAEEWYGASLVARARALSGVESAIVSAHTVTVSCDGGS
jgi:hypothetical protein